MPGLTVPSHLNIGANWSVRFGERASSLARSIYRTNSSAATSSGTFNDWWSRRIAHPDSGIRPDPVQEAAIRTLDNAHGSWSSKGSHRRGRHAAGGVYIYGPVGQGKTMIMKAFEDYLRSNDAVHTRVLRCHYADFMLMINSLLRSSTLRKLSPEEIFSGAAVQQVAGEAVYLAGDEGLDFISAKLGSYTHLLVDEININNISDALLFKRVITRLWSQGMFTVMTSNVAPKRLYEGGLNRSQFLDFIPQLEGNCVSLCLDSHHDYRLDEENKTKRGRSSIQQYNVPIPPLKELVKMLVSSAGGTEGPVDLRVLHGRSVNCEWLSEEGDEGLIAFNELCAKNCAASDYIGLATKITKQLYLSGIPSLNVELDGDAVRRFINLVDVFYEREIPIVYFAAAPPLKLVSGVAEDQLKALSTFDRYLDQNNLSCQSWWERNVQSIKHLTERGWIDAAAKALNPAQAKAIWDCKKDAVLTLPNLLGLLGYYKIFALGQFREGDPALRELVSEFGDGLIKAVDGSPINVKFAVPRLISRMVEAAGAAALSK